MREKPDVPDAVLAAHLWDVYALRAAEIAKCGSRAAEDFAPETG